MRRERGNSAKIGHAASIFFSFFSALFTSRENSDFDIAGTSKKVVSCFIRTYRVWHSLPLSIMDVTLPLRLD
jgi:hypothetical protein